MGELVPLGNLEFEVSGNTEEASGETGILNLKDGGLIVDGDDVKAIGPRSYLGAKKSADGEYDLSNTIALIPLEESEKQKISDIISERFRPPTKRERIRMIWDDYVVETCKVAGIVLPVTYVAATCANYFLN